MAQQQLITVTVPVKGILWLRDCADLELCSLDAPEENSEDEEMQEEAWEAIRIIDEAISKRTI